MNNVLKRALPAGTRTLLQRLSALRDSPEGTDSQQRSARKRCPPEVPTVLLVVLLRFTYVSYHEAPTSTE